MNIIIMEWIGGKYGYQLTQNCLELHQDNNHYNNLQGCLIYGIVHTLLGVAISWRVQIQQSNFSDYIYA